MPLQKGEEIGMGKNALMKKKKKEKKGFPFNPLEFTPQDNKGAGLISVSHGFKIAMEIKDIRSSDHSIFV